MAGVADCPERLLSGAIIKIAVVLCCDWEAAFEVTSMVAGVAGKDN